MYSVALPSLGKCTMCSRLLYMLVPLKKNTINLVKWVDHSPRDNNAVHTWRLKNCLQSHSFPGKDLGSQSKQATQHEFPVQSLTSTTKAELKQKGHLTWVEIVYTLTQFICTKPAGAFLHLMSSWPKRAVTPAPLLPKENMGTQIWHLQAGKNIIKMVKTALYFLKCLRRV